MKKTSKPSASSQSNSFELSSSSKQISKSQMPSPKPNPDKKDLNQILKSANRRGLKPKGQQGTDRF